MAHHLFILFVALVLDWFVGDPDWAWRSIPHPVVWFGRLTGFLDDKLNRESDTAKVQQEAGALALIAMVAAALVAGWVLGLLFWLTGPLGWLLELALVAILLAQKSLADHVRAVAAGLRTDGLEGGRKAVAMIVGRDPQQLDRSAVSRAAIESLAENFSDGVVAPAFWYAIFGLPGLLVYKMLNTADSMIGHRSARHLNFGKWPARADDFANWIPARLSAGIIALGLASISGITAARAAVGGALRDAGLHRSPNAGWPESAFAHGLGIALGGPRTYAGESVQQAWLNGSGKAVLDIADIEAALVLFARACFAFWLLIALALLVYG